jgi:predicted nucleic acid-binding protein
MQVLTLTDSSTCSAYDCEFVALAKQLSVKLVTQDKKILREFPDVAVSLDDFLNRVSNK